MDQELWCSGFVFMLRLVHKWTKQECSVKIIRLPTVFNIFKSSHSSSQSAALWTNCLSISSLFFMLWATASLNNSFIFLLLLSVWASAQAPAEGFNRLIHERSGSIYIVFRNYAYCSADDGGVRAWTKQKFTQSIHFILIGKYNFHVREKVFVDAKKERPSSSPPPWRSFSLNVNISPSIINCKNYASLTCKYVCVLWRARLAMMMHNIIMFFII